jgi:hypothetical protein
MFASSRCFAIIRVKSGAGADRWTARGPPAAVVRIGNAENQRAYADCSPQLRVLNGDKKNSNMQCMPQTLEQQLDGFVGNFEPTMADLIRECRSVLRKRFPTANELVYDNYNFFVIGYCTTERPSDCVVSLAANSKGLGLSFYHGATLPDPHRMLQGSGKQHRFVRLDGVATLSRPEVRDLLDAAEARAEPPFVAKGSGKLIIRSISEKKRPRR